MYLLTLDIGNSATKAGLFHDQTLLDSLRFGPGEEDGFLEWVRPRAIDAVASVNVVPKYAGLLIALIERALHLRVHTYSAFSALPFAMAYDTPETLGSDRVAASVGAWMRVGGQGTVVALDAGTALTIEVISEQKGYIGGVIAPGPALLRDSMAMGTAQLPLVDIPEQPPMVGASTTAAMRSGIMNGFVGAVEAMLGSILEDHPDASPIVMTGGWAGLLSRRLKFQTIVAPHLVLEGVAAMHSLGSQNKD